MVNIYFSELESANVRLSKKTINLLLFFGAVFLIATVTSIFSVDFMWLGILPSIYIPTIIRMMEISPFGELISVTLGNGMMAAPLVALYLCRKDNLKGRICHAYGRAGVSKIQTTVFIYGLAVPFIIALLWFIYSLPSGLFQSKPVTFGASVIHMLTFDRIMIVVFGPLLTMGLSLLYYILAIALLGPLANK